METTKIHRNQSQIARKRFIMKSDYTIAATYTNQISVKKKTDLDLKIVRFTYYVTQKSVEGIWFGF